MGNQPVLDEEVLARLEDRARANLHRRSAKGVDVSPRLLLALIAKVRAVGPEGSE